MRKYGYFILPIMIIILTSCEKEEFSGMEGVPIFMASIPFSQSDSVGFNAGDDAYYMFASHFETEEELIYSGLFGKEEQCEEGCAENFNIQFHQKLDSEFMLEIGNYEYYSIPKEGFKHDYTLLTNDPNSLENASWRVDGGLLSGESISIGSDNDAEQGGEEIALFYDIPSEITILFERMILPLAVDCDIQLSIRSIGQDIEVEVLSSSPFFQVSWSDGVIANKRILDPNILTYGARVFAGAGCNTDISLNLHNFELGMDYLIGFNQTTTGFETPDNADNAVSISYTDADGEFFTSSTIGQILPFKFDVYEVSEYEVNELGDPTWRIGAEFDCILFGENGKTKRIKNGHSTFAVSY